ncbi:DUF2194 domain-containing protein [Wukongibacter baidiensis]|uniref:DUF2194 domain-containing protein n=1 Tax=Wukongibacter baidiensis TaxID=1723361 RepID=UPI003D7FB1A4
MKVKRNIIIIILSVIAIAFAVEITRSEFIVRLNRNENFELIDLENTIGIQIDESLLQSLPSKKYLIIYDSDQEVFLKTKNNVEKVLDYIKREYQSIDIANVTRINNSYDSVIMVLDDMRKLQDTEELMNYVFKGGNLFFTFRLDYNDGFFGITRKLGIIEFGDYIDTGGIRLLDNILIKGKGFELKEEEFILNSSMSLRIEQDCEKYAESIDGVPLLWKKKYGQGNIVYFNGTMLEEKVNRGLVLGAIGALEEDFIYPIINTKISFIDDFPAPSPAGENERIKKEFGRTVPRFYKDIWWPDMLELASRYSVKYTGVVIGTYNDEVENIKPGSTDLNIKDYIYFGRELINNGGEIGIHGYNHQPLTDIELFDKDLGYKTWKDTKTMIDSIEEINRLSKQAFPYYKFMVYVPPSNILYPEGRKALVEADSDIKIISSRYNNSYYKDDYEQEFEISPDGIIEFPRLTSGYINSIENKWMILNGVTSYGIFSHFIHPDDVLDNHRTDGKGWSKLLEEYDEFNKMVFNNYRWLRAMTASEGANEMTKYIFSEPRYEKKDDYLKVYINNYFDNAYFVLKTKKAIESLEGCNVEKIDDNTYLVESYDPICQINFKR